MKLPLKTKFTAMNYTQCNIQHAFYTFHYILGTYGNISTMSQSVVADGATECRRKAVPIVLCPPMLFR